MALQYVAAGGEALDMVLYRHYGASAAPLDVVLAANPGLAAEALSLPVGRVVVLPDLEAPASSGVKLWD